MTQDLLSSKNNLKFFIKRFHPTFKIIILASLLCLILRLPLSLELDKAFIFFYCNLFIILLLICCYYDNFLIYFLKQIKRIRFLFVFSFLIQLHFHNNNDNEDNLLKIPYLRFGDYNLLLFFILLLFYFFTNYRIKWKLTYFFMLLFLFFVLPTFFVDTLNSFNSSFISLGPPGHLYLHKQSFLRNLFTVLKIMILMMMIFIFVKSTPFSEIIDGLAVILSPLKTIKIPIDIFLFMLSLIIVSFPFLLQETNKILKAQIARGMNWQKKSFFQKIDNLLSLLVPIFILVFKRSLVLSQAMELRSYVLSAPRTKIILYNVKKRDYLFLGIFLFLVIFLFSLVCK